MLCTASYLVAGPPPSLFTTYDLNQSSQKLCSDGSSMVLEGKGNLAAHDIIRSELILLYVLYMFANSSKFGLPGSSMVLEGKGNFAAHDLMLSK